MIPRWRWLLDQITHLLWLRAALFALIGVITALLGVAAETFLPYSVPELVGADAVGTVLNVLASSMLAVTTFSLGVMLSAYTAATNNVTPRATKLLMQDTTTQNVLSTFIGSFLFSLVGIVTLTIEGYGQRGRLVLFIVTVGVILVIITALLRWIDHLSRLGRVGETTQRVEDAATRAIERRIEQPCLGGRPFNEEVQVPHDAIVVTATDTGYVQHVDSAALEQLAKQHEGRIFLDVLPGSYVAIGNTIARIEAASDQESESGDDGDDADPATEWGDAIRASITIGPERTYDQDPRFGIVVLSEVASRALSQAINDSGTAIDVISRLVRVFALWGTAELDRAEHLEEQHRQHEKEQRQRRLDPDGKAEPADADDEDGVPCPHVYVLPLRFVDLFEDAFMPIARDGADKLEVQLRLQKALGNLAGIGSEEFRDAALLQARICLEEAERGLNFDRERRRVREAAAFATPMD